MTTAVKSIEETLEQLRAELPETMSMEWLDDHKDALVQVVAIRGVAVVSAALGISKNTLRSWRRRRGLAPQRTQTDEKDLAEGADAWEIIPLDLIDPNPWQPRKTMDREYLEGLADSIDKHDLLQLPLGRRMESGRVQSAFGGQRVEAVRLLAEAGKEKWQNGIPMTIKPLSDQEMAVVALEENAKRKDIDPLEQFLGYQKVIDDGLLNVTELAESVGLARSTVSNNLRILNLPDEALEHFRNGSLSAHAARELLALWAPDHDHESDIMAVIHAIENTSTYYGAPDWSIKSVREKIADRVRSGNREAWRPLFEPDRNSYVYGSSYSPPTFDIETFAKEYPTRVHHIPTRADKATAWTCHDREWRRLQSAATRNPNTPNTCLLYTSPSPRDRTRSRMPSSA